MATRVYVALGSNLGNRRGNLTRAVERIDRLEGTRVTARSSLWETEPVDCPEGSPRFLNAVVELRTSLDPGGLLAGLQGIERDLGRPPGLPRNAPRSIDLDILLFGSQRMRDETLEIPHPRMGARAFVLIPLAELNPDLRPPGEKRTVREMLEELPPRIREDARRVGVLS